ncbi:hypothetical protein OAJ07_02860 [Gemmatimonadales bacterium]|nr:hypothetical protein [Gemmatimonadales bacterium]
MSDETGSNLSRQQFDSVIRRAAELATADLDAKEGRMSEVELFRIASEVGLRETDVRKALMEVRSSGGGGTTLDRIFGFETVTASRVVSDAKVDLKDRLDDFLVASQLLRPVRRTPDLLVYQPAVDWVSRLARAASFTSQEHYIASAKSVEVRLEKLDDEGVLVELLVDHGNRSVWITQAVLGGGVVGAAAGALVTVLGGIVTGGLITLPSVAGFFTCLGVWIVVGNGVAQRRKTKIAQVIAEIDGVLDRLETREALEPPPASWRRWVKRHFHGVARDFSRTAEGVE